MVDDVHAPRGAGGVAGPVDGAVREGWVGDPERGFEEVGEFWEDVGRCGAAAGGRIVGLGYGISISGFFN